ncbi:hypothetical protein Tco_1086886 [Tanacetum coccineum]
MTSYVVSSRGLGGDYTSSCPPSLVLAYCWLLFVFSRSDCAECVITQLMLRALGLAIAVLGFILSRLTQSDLNGLIRKYNIPLDLRPRLPPVEAVVSELPNNVIALYYRMFDFYEVRIPFSSFLLYVNKHFKVHFSQIGPLGLNKSVFNGKRVIPDSMPWRHANLVITDPKPPAGSCDEMEVRRLSVFIVKLGDMPEGIFFLSGLIRV